MDDGFDTKELTDFEKDLLNLAQRQMPRETKKFLRKEGTKIKNATKAVAKQRVKRKTGAYHKSIKRGKLYKYKGTGDLAIRAYSGAPHAHLIEYGHRNVGKDGTEHGFTAGKRVFETAEKRFKPEFYEDTQNFIDDALEKGLK